MNPIEFIEKRVAIDESIDDIATIIGECIDQAFIEGFVDFLEKPTTDNALYVSKKLKTLFADYIKDIE